MPELYATENPTVADYRAAREATPEAIIPAPGEPWVRDENGGLMVYARDAANRTGWYHVMGDVFIPD